MTSTLLTGWGRTAPTSARVETPVDVDAMADLVRSAALARSVAHGRGVIGRGLGRSYNDAAQNGGGLVVDTTSLTGIEWVDAQQGIVRADAGVSIDALIRFGVPQGWFVPVTPGTRQVTVAGAIAADIHGKNHHRHGSWSQHCLDIGLVDGRGDVRRLTPDDTGFWATVGGMGLTGLITDATIQMTPVGSSRLLVDTERAPDLDDVLERMTTRDEEYGYSVAWIDLLAGGRSLGRSVLTRGDFAAAADLPADLTDSSHAFDPMGPIPSPPWFPNGLLNRASIRAFNEAWYRKAPSDRRGEIQTIGTFFHPLDGVDGWNRLYGSRGFVQWQCVVPFAATETLRHIVERCSNERVPTFLAVLKRFGPAGPAPLSFPAPGWTLALDVPAAVDGLAALLDELDLVVLDAGGRVYLAKDGRVRPELLAAMYPRLDEWRAARSELDPDGVFASDLSRRLRLV